MRAYYKYMIKKAQEIKKEEGEWPEATKYV